jgi:hypothetical protein
LSDSCSNSADSQASANVDGDGNGGSGGGGYDDEDWAFQDENDHNFYMILFRASSGYKPPQKRQIFVSLNKLLMLFFSANLFEETAAETNRYVSKKPYATLTGSIQISNCVSPGVP